MISSSSPRQNPVISNMRVRMPASRRGMASSSEVTPSQRAPSSSSARAHSVAPCPYASAFTTAQMVIPGPMRRCTAPKLQRRLVSETWAQVGRVAVRFRISAVATEGDYSGHIRLKRRYPGATPRPSVGGGSFRKHPERASFWCFSPECSGGNGSVAARRISTTRQIPRKLGDDAVLEDVLSDSRQYLQSRARFAIRPIRQSSP